MVIYRCLRFSKTLQQMAHKSLKWDKHSAKYILYLKCVNVSCQKFLHKCQITKRQKSHICVLMMHHFQQLQDSMITELPEDEITTWTDTTSESTTRSTTSGTPEACEWGRGRGYRQQRYLHFVRDAVYAVAQALHNMQATLCGPGVTGVCKAMRHIDGDLLRTYLANVTFNGKSTDRPWSQVCLTV